MNPYTVILYISCCLLFILLLLGRIAPDKTRRDRFTLAWGITWGVSGLVLIFGTMFLNGGSPEVENLPFLMSFGFFVPLFVALLVNKEWFGPAIVIRKRTHLEMIYIIVTILFCSYCILTFTSMINNPRISDIQSKPAPLLLAFFIVPMTITLVALVFQKIEFGMRGIFNHGFTINYSDIAAYTWQSTGKAGDEMLVLRVKFFRWIRREKILLSAQDKPAVENLLAQHMLGQTGRSPDQPSPS